MVFRAGLRTILAVLLLSPCISALADSCQVVKEHATSAAEQAYLKADYEKSAGLYRTDLASHPNDPQLTAELVRVLLRQQKLQEALDIVEAAVKANASSTSAQAVLLTAKAEIQIRQGLLWEVGTTLAAAQKADLCLPRIHLVEARYGQLNSQYEMARSQLQLAHQLDPKDPDIRRQWISTLPRTQRIAELENYLNSATGDDAEDRRRLQLALEGAKKSLEEPQKPCRLVSTVTSTEMPFAQLMFDATHLRAVGLDIKLNQHKARLEIDTGAGGVIVSRSVADKAGLKPFSKDEIGGVGSEGSKAGYTAFADSIQVGDMEFHDCIVRVADNSRLDVDGLIGMDVFARFLVTLNYPDHKLILSPLPQRPNEAVTAPTLGTNAADESDAQKSGSPVASETAKSGSTTATPPAIATKGPYNRYIAPEMKDYTAVYRQGHMLMLPVALNHSKLRLFILDTGAWKTSITPEAAREVTKVHTAGAPGPQGLSGRVDKYFMADEITFSFGRIAQKIDGVPAFDTSQLSKNLGLDVSGFLGARTLELTTIHIDYRDGLVKFDYDPKKAPRSRND
jgi:predicted aspartyl protease